MSARWSAQAATVPAAWCAKAALDVRGAGRRHTLAAGPRPLGDPDLFAQVTVADLCGQDG